MSQSYKISGRAFHVFSASFACTLKSFLGRNKPKINLLNNNRTLSSAIYGPKYRL